MKLIRYAFNSFQRRYYEGWMPISLANNATTPWEGTDSRRGRGLTMFKGCDR
jgi:hypothetical protein